MLPVAVARLALCHESLLFLLGALDQAGHILLTWQRVRETALMCQVCDIPLARASHVAKYKVSAEEFCKGKRSKVMETRIN